MSAPPAPQEQQPNNSIEAPERVRDYASPTECSDLREHYNACFFRWYQEDFLQNYTTELGCDTEWRAYNACIQVRASACYHVRRRSLARSLTTRLLRAEEAPCLEARQL